MKVMRWLIIILIVGLLAMNEREGLQASQNQFSTIVGPAGTSASSATGINAQGAIVGTYCSNSCSVNTEGLCDPNLLAGIGGLMGSCCGMATT